MEMMVSCCDTTGSIEKATFWPQQTTWTNDAGPVHKSISVRGKIIGCCQVPILEFYVPGSSSKFHWVHRGLD